MKSTKETAGRASTIILDFCSCFIWIQRNSWFWICRAVSFSWWKCCWRWAPPYRARQSWSCSSQPARRWRSISLSSELSPCTHLLRWGQTLHSNSLPNPGHEAPKQEHIPAKNTQNHYTQTSSVVHHDPQGKELQGEQVSVIAVETPTQQHLN